VIKSETGITSIIWSRNTARNLDEIKDTVVWIYFYGWM